MTMTDLQRQLGTDHVELVALFEQLRNTVEGADAPTIQRIWADFEERLLAHMDGEEEFLLPELEARHPDEVVHTREDHARIRALLIELGIRADLHVLRKSSADALVTLLKEHAGREDRTLYAWADAEVSHERRTSLLERLRKVATRATAALAP